MGPRIALLLSGLSTDLSAVVCAVQLADRTGRRLYAIRAVESGAGNGEGELDGFRFATEFADAEGVKATCHLLESASVEDVAGFILANSITCLVVGACPEEMLAARERWLDDLRQRLREAPQRFFPDLLVIKAPVLAEEDLERIVSQSRRLKSLASGRKAS